MHMHTDPIAIDSVSIRHVLLPLKREPVLHYMKFTGWPVILIDLQTSDGVVGRSYLLPYVKTAYRYIAPMIHDLVERFKGKPARPLDVFAQARASFGPIGLEGACLAAVSGLDMALWDALARRAGQPLATYLGGSLGPIQAYSSNGLFLIGPDALEREAVELAAEGGFSALKLRLGYPSAQTDLASIAAVRRGVGADVRLMADFSQIFPMGEAISRCTALDDQGLYWIEEPVAYDNLQGMADLRRRLRTPIQIGENFWGPRSLHHAVEMGATDFVMPDLMRIGGVTGWLRAAGIAAGRGIPVSTHLYTEFSSHLMRVTETAHWIEWNDSVDMILADPLRPKDGRVEVSSRPGSGIEWDEAAIKRYLQEG